MIEIIFQIASLYPSMTFNHIPSNKMKTALRDFYINFVYETRQAFQYQNFWHIKLWWSLPVYCKKTFSILKFKISQFKGDCKTMKSFDTRRFIARKNFMSEQKFRSSLIKFFNDTIKFISLECFHLLLLAWTCTLNFCAISHSLKWNFYFCSQFHWKKLHDLFYQSFYWKNTWIENLVNAYQNQQIYASSDLCVNHTLFNIFREQ